ncbi:MAG: hypothetical protein IJV85_04815 [Clostridia bacterium]|nr:hypothetical protein [Clostridia bacterium]
MTTFLRTPKRFLHRNIRWLSAIAFALVFLLSIGCTKKLDYFSYVSELRDNIFLAQTDELSLKIYSVTKEHPYAADGIPKDRTARVEAYLAAPSGEKTYELFFTVDGKEYGGEMSYDNVKAEYFFSCSLNVSALKEIPCVLLCGEERTELSAQSVVNDSTLSAKTVLQGILTEEQELFNSLTDKYGFAGEIYVRLLYEDNAYYYVGIVDRSGNSHAFLVNAQTGKILAKRHS